MGNLAVSRSFGDKEFKGCGVIAKPFIVCKNLEIGDKLLLACDGIWDVVYDNEIPMLLNLRRETPIKNLLLEAYFRKTSDNVSVMMIESISYETLKRVSPELQDEIEKILSFLKQHNIITQITENFMQNLIAFMNSDKEILKNFDIKRLNQIRTLSI